jgi:hypothetical protein
MCERGVLASRDEQVRGLVGMVATMSAYRHYLRDLGYELRQRAVEARETMVDVPTEFDRGRHQAYYEVLSLMQQQAAAFDLPLADLALDGFDADRDLL